MSDPRFARLKTDPRFRKPKKQETKVLLDDRFKSVFQKKSKKGAKVDKYGRPVSKTQNSDNLARFYRLENDAEPQELAPDYARGEGLVESSEEEEDTSEEEESHTVALGKHRTEPITIHDDADINLDEDNYTDLDAQAAAYNKEHPEDKGSSEGEQTRRLAVVNLDWDHVRATHLFKIFSSLVSSVGGPVVASSGPSDSKHKRGAAINIARGKIISVKVYLSDFGKTRLAQEEKEGPPAYIFKRKGQNLDEEVNEQNIYDVGDDNEYDEDALRKYQLERLRFYYAIATCDTADTAAHIYAELDGTELERSANVFDLSFVPDEMEFDGQCRDEAFADVNTGYRNVDFVTDALRHSKVTLTWDQDDPERNQITRRTLTKQEIEDADFKAYIASSSSESDSEVEDKIESRKARKKSKAVSRDKLRALLLGGGDDELPEGWGEEKEDDKDVDMEITFTPGLTASGTGKDETTLDKYQRKMKEKRQKRKEEVKEKTAEKSLAPSEKSGDEFFEDSEDRTSAATKKGKKSPKVKSADREGASLPSARTLSTPAELALLVSPDNLDAEPKHFNLKSVIKAEKKTKGKHRKQKKTKNGEEADNEIQEEFAINVKDDRFKALHDDHTFAIDPTNPHFKKTKGMSALLEERTKRQKEKRSDEGSSSSVRQSAAEGERSLNKLVESVKRKTAAAERTGTGKRQKLQ